MTERTQHILRREHERFLAHEQKRAARRGPRTEAERARLVPVLRAQRERWADAGGANSDFLLAPRLRACEQGEPLPLEPARAARNGGRKRKR